MLLPFPSDRSHISSLYRDDMWDYRDFLSEALESVRTEARRNLSYSALSKALGFKSKSFLQHLIRKEKHLSSESASSVARSLGLNSRERRIFLSLFLLGKSEAKEPRSRGTEKLKSRIQALREKKGLQRIHDSNPSATFSLFRSGIPPLVYSALGSPQTGATERMIMNRTSLSKKEVQSALKRLEESGLAERKRSSGEEERFVAKHPFIFEDAEETREGVRLFYLALSSEALKEAARDFSSDKKLFAAYAFSIDSGRIHELKKRLKDVLNEFMVEAEQADGDRVARLTFSLIP